MKKFYPLFIFTLFSYYGISAQNPAIIQAVGGSILEPARDEQVDWVNNKWQGKFFYQGTGSPTKLCVTDGTNTGTYFVADIGNGELVHTIPAKDFMYIITNQLVSFSPFTYQAEIWRSDGTASGTVLVKTMPQIASASISNNWTSNRRNENFSVVNNRMYFGGYDAVNGDELWVTDGTLATTKMIKDIKPGATGSAPWGFCHINNEVFFSCMETGLERKLWKTDGTEAGTVQVAVPEPFFMLDYAIGKLGNKMVFYAHNTIDGYEPYVSDGTPAGTFMLKNIHPSGNAKLNTVQSTEWNIANGFCFFIAYNGTANALWRTDGTTAGTIQLTTNAANVSSANSAQSYTNSDGKTLWMLQHSPSRNSKLFRSNGYPEGTYMVATGLNLPDKIVLYKNAAWFAARPAGISANLEPWRSGGNAATTNVALEIAPGFPTGYPTLLFSSNPHGFFVNNNKLHFFATPNGSSSSLNLYQYNGDFTFNGTQLGGRWRDSANWNSSMPPGITDTVYINNGTPNVLNINGATAYAGILNLGSDAVVSLTSSTDSLIVSNQVNAGNNSSFTGNGILTLRNNMGDTVQINNSVIANNVAIQSDARLNNGNTTIQNQILLSHGKLLLQNNNLILAGTTSAATGNDTAYIVTDSLGSLQIEQIGASGRTSATTFPIGTLNNYAPATISNLGVADRFSARVIATVNQNYTTDYPTGLPYVSGAVNHTWFINEATNGGSNVTLTVQWKAAQELPQFNRLTSHLAHYTGGTWDLGPQTSAIGTDWLRVSRNNITGFSPFGVVNANTILPLHWLSFGATQCRQGNICLQWNTANEQQVERFEIERSSDAVLFTPVGSVRAQNRSTNAYSFIDFTAALKNSKLYYRLKQIDADGNYQYSRIVMLQYNVASPSIYPNPVTTEFSLNEWQTIQQLQLYHLNGQLLQQWDRVQQTISIGHYARGMYILKVVSNNGLINYIKILKQ